MKKLIIIFSALSLLIFMRPVLGLGTDINSATSTSVATTQVDNFEEESIIDEALDGIKTFYSYTGFANSSSGNVIMIIIGIVFIYLGIKFDYEPLLLIPIGAEIGRAHV